MSLSPGARIGSYEVLGQIGAGGMGEVYRGRDLRLQRPVAIKVITRQLTDDDLVRRFESEALSASALNHPNIITVYEFGVHEGLQYLVTEFIEGQTLRERIRHGPLRIGDALGIAIQVASALDSAHGAGLVHRDVKPENVMIRPDGYVKVLDFGLAKLSPTARAAAENLTVSLRTIPGTILGTIGYMAPEQVRGLEVDHRADIWSLGVVLHEIIAGSSPFAGPTSSDVIASVLEREPPPLAIEPPAPAELQRIVAKTLAKKPDQRYQTIADLLIDLRRLQAQLEGGTGVPLPGANASPRPASARNTRRALAGIGVIVLVAISMFGVPTLQRWRESSREAARIAALPQRTIHYWLTVQKMRDGQPYMDPFESSGREIFENGWRFRFNLESAEAGFLYLLNEGPDAEGRTLRVLYPTPSIRGGSARVDGGHPVETGVYRMDEHTGTEHYWIVWSASELLELERAKRWANPDDQGVIRDRAEADRVRTVLTTHENDTKIDVEATSGRTAVRGRGDVLAIQANLSHH